MASIVVTGDTSGAITIAAPAVAGTNTLTLPASTGTLVVTGGAQTIEFADGSAATPSITNSGDTNTGMFFPAADTIAFTEGGTESMRINASGQVGIGTSSPTQQLDVTATSSATATIVAQNTTATSGGAQLRAGNPQNLFIIGTDSNGGGLTGTANSSFFYTTSTSPIVFMPNATERMRIDSSGNVLVGTTNTNPIVTGAVGNVFMSGSGFRIAQTSGASYIGINSASGTTLQFYTYSGGLSTAGAITSSGTTTSYGTSSDYRLKENITPLTNALNKVTQLKPVSFTWTGDKRNDTGFIAHELQEVMPNAVYGEKDAVDNEGNPIYQNVDTSFLVATLTAAIQELNAKVDAQATTVQEQQAIITDLKARIETLEGAK